MSSFTQPEKTFYQLVAADKRLRDVGYAITKLSKYAGYINKYYLSGRLVINSNNYCCLEVPVAFVRGLYDALNLKGIQPLFSIDGSRRAYITVMTPAEVASIGGPSAISERGHFFNYTTGAVREVNFNNNEKWSKFWILEIKSLDLEQLRKSYGLPAFPWKFNHFLLTIAARRKHVFKENEVSKVSKRDN